VTLIVAFGTALSLFIVEASKQHGSYVVQSTFMTFAQDTVEETHMFTAHGCSDIISASNKVTLHNDFYHGVVDVTLNRDKVTFTATCPGHYEFALECDRVLHTYNVYVGFDMDEFGHGMDYSFDRHVDYHSFRSHCAERSKCVNVCDGLRRWRTFRINAETVRSLNLLSKDGVVYATNSMSILTPKEIQKRSGTIPDPPTEYARRHLLINQKAQPSSNLHNRSRRRLVAPRSHVIAREHLTAVKDQGECGDCYANAATETLETAIAISLSKTAVELSVYHGSACYRGTREYAKGISGNGGCQGGTAIRTWDMWNDLKYAVYADSKYKDSTMKQLCVESTRDVSKRASFTALIPRSITTENDMALALQDSPVSVCLHGNDSKWQLYKDGIMSCNDARCDHSVAVVGYHNLGNPDDGYWIVRNSYGSSWGISGYAYLRMGSATDTKSCTHILLRQSYALKVESPSIDQEICSLDDVSQVGTCDSSEVQDYECCSQRSTTQLCADSCKDVIRPWSKKTNSDTQQCINRSPTPACPDKTNDFKKDSAYWTIMLKGQDWWNHGRDNYCELAFGYGSYNHDSSSFMDCGKNGGKDFTGYVSSCCTYMTTDQIKQRTSFLRNLKDTTITVEELKSVDCYCGAKACKGPYNCQTELRVQNDWIGVTANTPRYRLVWDPFAR
jgi:C1A family cysteine protease